MKATSIEQIREHLARGGTVTVNSPQWNTHRVVERVAGESSKGPFSSVVWFTTGGAINFDKRFDWELLPIEEEKKERKQISLAEACERVDEIQRQAQERRKWRPTSFPDAEEAMPAELHQRIRQSLLFGHYPAMNDLLDWWQATTGERIEWGRRCDTCECSGSITVHRDQSKNKNDWTCKCIACNGSGYTVRPTWMEDQCQPQ